MEAELDVSKFLVIQLLERTAQQTLTTNYRTKEPEYSIYSCRFSPDFAISHSLMPL